MDSILIVEDSPEFQTLLTVALSDQYDVACVSDGRKAFEILQRRPVSLLILDIQLEGSLHGLDLCHLLRKSEETKHIPILVLTSKKDIQTLLTAFELGADDFMVKPFEPRELKARIKVRLRATRGLAMQNRFYEVGPLRVDFVGFHAYVGHRPLSLTALEFKLLSFFVRHIDHVLTREQILNGVWGISTSVTDRVIDSHVKALRKKLGECRSYIQSIYGEGYRFAPALTEQLSVSPEGEAPKKAA